MNFLVVDDSRLMRLLIMNAIAEKWADATCVEAEDGGGAETALIEAPQPFDAIMLDINMPGTDGMTLLGTLGEDDRFKNIPVLMISSDSEEDKVIDALSLGARGFLAKPFETPVLHKEIERIIEEGKNRPR
jgi:two-component system chemotaxis response regulator CheY